jgi:hypothetical protein
MMCRSPRKHRIIVGLNLLINRCLIAGNGFCLPATLGYNGSNRGRVVLAGRANAPQATVAGGWNAVTALEARKVRGLQDA